MTTTSTRSLVRWSLCAALLAAVAPIGATLEAQDSTRAEPTSTSGPALARSDVELTRAAIQTNRTAIVTSFMSLTDAQSTKFWPLYREYRNAAQRASDETVKFVASLADRTTPLSNAEAQRGLATYLRRQEEAAKVNTTYSQKFLAILPARQVARLFQLENKMDAIVAYELAGAIPLVGDQPAPPPAKPDLHDEEAP